MTALHGEARVSRLQAQVDALLARVTALESKTVNLQVYGGGHRPRPAPITLHRGEDLMPDRLTFRESPEATS